MCSAGTPRSGQCSQGAGGAAFKPCLPAAAAPLPLRKVRFCWDFSLAARSSLLAGGRARRAAPWLHTATLHRPCRTWELLPRALGPAPSCTGAGASPVRLQRLGVSCSGTASLGISCVSATFYIMGFVCSSRRCSDSLSQCFQSVNAWLQLPSSCLLGQLCASQPLPVHWA